MRHSLNSIKEVISGGATIGVIKGDARSLDYGSDGICGAVTVFKQGQTLPFLAPKRDYQWHALSLRGFLDYLTFDVPSSMPQTL